MELEFSNFYEVINDPNSNGEVEESLTQLYNNIKRKLPSATTRSQRRFMLYEFQNFLTKKANKHPHLAFLDILYELRHLYPSLFNHEAPAPLIVYQRQLQKLSERHEYILKMLRKYKFESDIIAIMSRFFSLKDEMNNNFVPSWYLIDYLKRITNALHRLFLNKNIPDVEKELFNIFIRYNFNHEEVYEYYVRKIDTLLLDMENRKVNLELVEIESLTSVKSKMYYRKGSNSLATDIRGEVMKRKSYILAKENGFLPLEFNESSGVYVGIINILIKTKLINPPKKREDLFENLAKITRGPGNKKYADVSIKNSSKLKNEKHLLRMKAIFNNAEKEVDKRIMKNRA